MSGRIEPIGRREDLAPAQQAVWDRIARSRGKVAGPFAVLLHSPEMAERVAALGAYIRFESGMEPPLRELAILAVARQFDCRYEWAAHVPEARKAGVRAETIAAVRERAPQRLSDDEALVVRYVDALLGSRRVDDAAFVALRKRFGTAQLVELTATIGYYAMLACTLNAFDLAPDPGAEDLDVP